MAPDGEPPLRDQLVEARKRIIAQLDELVDRATVPEVAPGVGHPDYRSVIAELEDELRQINAILGIEGAPGS